jgi:hypothetical protein
MNYKNILFGLILLTIIFNSTMVFAENKDIRYYYDNIDEIKVDFVNNIEQLPKIIQKSIKNDRMKLEIETTTDQLDIYIQKMKTGDYNITKEKIENVNVWLIGKEETINRIIESEEPMAEINQALKSKELKIKTKGLFRSIKYKLAKLFIR